MRLAARLGRLRVIRLPRWCATRLAGERGSILPFAVAGAALLTLIGLLFLVPLGQAVTERRTQATAADAAALASVELWADGLEDVHSRLLHATSPADFWALLGRPLDAYGPSGMRAAAGTYAGRNDAELQSHDVRVRPGAGEVRVEVKSHEPVDPTGHYIYAEATARIELRGGLCLAGGLLGVDLDGGCRTAAEPTEDETAETQCPADGATETPTGQDGETPEPEPTCTPEPPDPFDPPVSALRIETRLVG
ncbi:hypothetical protein FE374_15910 [Georgenia yuyongxinii]|uniref:Putative Flp pilus-assembly TadG-like N-terminal domain-containing protein n=1 Tax=Georgenia yuyongxinii TaxID=2589797 RepID=A0A5B8CCM8_9MICO|nr:pilus assembly protein TadG-related protein [Georgenia yuyongxinii]QDC25906.1 hypothetical protein FE374_15910 [Georgenia yuyongxinii]